MPTVPIPARKAATTFDTPSKRERIEVKPPITRFIRRAVTRVFGVWSRISTQVVRQWDWYPRVEPYVGYGTGDYSRLICRTVYAPRHAQSGELIRGIRGMVEKDIYCADILVQVAAVNSALNGFSKELLAQHVRTCVADDLRAGSEEKLDELIKLLPKLMK